MCGACHPDQTGLTIEYVMKAGNMGFHDEAGWFVTTGTFVTFLGESLKFAELGLKSYKVVAIHASDRTVEMVEVDQSTGAEIPDKPAEKAEWWEIASS